jgi:hypothetical protein
MLATADFQKGRSTAMVEPTQAPDASAQPKWRPLERNERRVAGVLAEKAKTTPENYPMSINALVSGSNQKSNRFPQMQLDEAQVSEALDSLRRAGAVALIQGDGRVEKFRHLLYDWLGVDKAELAVMTELLLRGAQTLGELRGRAARMEPIADIGALQPIVDRLRQKGLVVFLTPPGRGAVVTHNLYQPQELAKLRSEHAGGGGGDDGGHAGATSSRGVEPVAEPMTTRTARPGGIVSPPAALDAVGAVTANSAALDELRIELATLRRELAELRDQTEGALEALRSDVDDVKSQVGG